jgi:hypothetical protein
MKRMIVIFLLLLGIGGLGALVLLLRRDEPVQTQTVREEPVYVVRIGTGDVITRITVHNANGAFTVVPGSDADNTKPYILGFEDLSLNAWTVSMLLSRLSMLSSHGLVMETASDLKPFGLDNPKAEVKIAINNGQELTLYIGAEAPDAWNVYVKTSASPAIHLVSAMDMQDYLRRDLDFVDTALSPGPADTSGMTALFNTIEFGGTVRAKEPITIVYTDQQETSSNRIQPNPYRIVRPIEMSLNMDRGLKNIQALFGITADRVVSTIKPGSLEQYGLAEPYSTVMVQAALDKGGFRLLASAPDEAGNVYILRDGTQVIYEIAATKLPWLELSFFDFMEKLVIFPFIDRLASVELNYEGAVTAFTLSGEGDDLQIQYGNTVLDTANFRTFYQTLIAAMYDGYYDAGIPQGATPFLRITYRYRDGTSPDQVAFYQAASRRVLTSLNGGRPFFTYTAYIDKILADRELILAGKRVASYL